MQAGTATHENCAGGATAARNVSGRAAHRRIARASALVLAATLAFPAALAAAQGATPRKSRPKAPRTPHVKVVPPAPAPQPGAPPGSYEALRADAQELGDPARTLEPFTEECREQRDMTRRQCEVVRRYLREVLRGRVFRSAVEPGALVVGPYSSRLGGRTLTLRGCLACRAPIAGDLRYLLTVRPPTALAGGLAGLDIATLKVAHPSQYVAEQWERDVGAKLRTELIFKLGPVWTKKAPRLPRARPGKGAAAPPAWNDGSGQVRGMTLSLLGYRVYDRCSGKVLVSSPKSALPVPADRRQADCPRPEAKKPATTRPAGRQPDSGWPYVLSVGDIRRAMDSVRGQVYACYLQFQVPGKAELEVEVGGLDGNVLGVKVTGDFEGTPTGDCVAAAVSLARFPHFRAASMKVPYNFFLR